MFTQRGTQVDIYDYVSADTLEKGDQIAHSNDLVEVTHKIDSGESILLKGFSHVSGDSVTYVVTPDTEVGLWAV